MELPVAAFLTAAVYLNAYFFQMGVLGFYGYPNITGSLSISLVVESVVPGLLFYSIAFMYFSTFLKVSNIILIVVLLLIPLPIFIYFFYKVNAFETEIGISRISERVSVVMVFVSFYTTVCSLAGLRISTRMNSSRKYLFAVFFIITVMFSGVSLGRMYAYLLGDVYKMDGMENSYILKIYNDRLILAECTSNEIKYSLISDFSKYKMIRLKGGEERKRLRTCLLKNVKDIDI